MIITRTRLPHWLKRKTQARAPLSRTLSVMRVSLTRSCQARHRRKNQAPRHKHEARLIPGFLLLDLQPT
ncbi:hypothetical protein CHD2B1_061 [Escherichia phage vB_EcoS-CHD2B1]|nr:hypothetical protein CHD2B1_061 [Escherichia phage vB_EcoS-CHD2B1]